METPQITCYARVIDNLTGKVILDFNNGNGVWYYGKCNGEEGGESQYIVEFDIWNNEPAYNAGNADISCSNAINCRLNVWSDETCVTVTSPLFLLPDPFMYAKCSYKTEQEFKPIKNLIGLTEIYGNVNPNLKGVLQGIGDHTLLQTKIVLPKNSNLENKRHDFVLAFTYEYVD